MGLAAAETFVREGAKVVLSDTQDEIGTAAAERLGENARYVRTDVTSEDAISALIAETVKEFGRLDVFFSNAGAGGDQSPIDDLSQEGLERTLALNLQSHVYAHKHAARQFREQGTAGSIITTGSTSGLQAGWSGGAYSISKAGVLALVRQTAFENQGTGIRSNAIIPGGVLTPIISNTFGVSPEQSDEFLAAVGEKMGTETLIGRAGLPQDIANAALFLASDLSLWITGVGLPVDGGALAVTKDASASLIFEAATEFLAK